MTEKLRAGIVGWPVTHSLSPVLHGYWLNEYGIDGEMVREPARPEEFAAVIARLRSEGFKGVNVTVPHKETAFALADEVEDAQAKFSGAANLLVFRDGKIFARNTDAFGFSDSIETSLPSGVYTGKSAVLLGAGGAARAIVFAL
ncbi:MAG TPA: hypothetical protein VJM78_02965, partial [Rhizomicrobium sp.]|nr:hypothetical protein [Rhizomicrobium sp.]